MYKFPESLEISSFSIFLWVYGQTARLDPYVFLSFGDYTDSKHILFKSTKALLPILFLKQGSQEAYKIGSETFQVTNHWAYVGVSFDANSGKFLNIVLVKMFVSFHFQSYFIIIDGATWKKYIQSTDFDAN